MSTGSGKFSSRGPFTKDIKVLPEVERMCSLKRVLEVSLPRGDGRHGGISMMWRLVRKIGHFDIEESTHIYTSSLLRSKIYPHSVRVDLGCVGIPAVRAHGETPLGNNQKESGVLAGFPEVNLNYTERATNQGRIISRPRHEEGDRSVGEMTGLPLSAHLSPCKQNMLLYQSQSSSNKMVSLTLC
ncbi:uncharacterized protein CIMG_13180 [Coccidioides immitis RS]|uniref:Uncharacterized protein n=1 Tax=Coccidioides immitis (strain RS) TaxID=246410 RepID=J3K601_COCIM|nr:uncharacterized protein CIMG_13180 [Coccidioides immitis RS]EAS29927.3 hypothetical protein CIMG_13180 [Coccidioides immitis RS]